MTMMSKEEILDFIKNYNLTPEKLAKIIDHTNVKPYSTEDDIVNLCDEAKLYNFGAVCVNSCYVPLAKKELENTDIAVCSVVGFPLGAATTKTKVYEAKEAIKNGATQIDMVINIGKLKSRQHRYVKKDIRSIVKIAHSKGAIVRVICENCYLSKEEKIKAYQLAKKAEADFIKTSTGFGKPKDPNISSGATVEDIKLMRATVGPEMGIKAAGGIRTIEDTIEMIKAGANRIGTSSGVKIIEGLKQLCAEIK
jgi:deoxyribose-phosphate aldolase